MGVTKRYRRHSAVVIARKQWKGVRHAALKRDGFKCTECGRRGRLECHHVKPVRTHPLLAYELSNIAVLCVACHARHTRLEVGMGTENPAREAWRGLVNELQSPSTRKELQHA